VDVANAKMDGMPEAMLVDQQALRRVCGCFVTGVTVVTSSTPKHPVGITINSFTSVSLDPPLVLFCIHEQSTILGAIRAAEIFAVNILAEEQADLCRTFATPGAVRFAGVSLRPGLTGAPILTETLAYLDCQVRSLHPAGDHWIVLGEVLDLGLLRDGRPLTFFRSSYPRLEFAP
jgi:3-hydroxy-9,10-secoandrosta-1,3,5(10)-triene-9,17-dione monooxygenase reductase component